MKIIKNFLTKCQNYKNASKITPQGLMLHSVGCNQPKASVFLNTFNNASLEKGVHGFIDANDTVYQTLPFNYKAWHCGGSANATHLGFEMTEPSTITYKKNSSQFTDNDPTATRKHVKATYDTAVVLFAKLCVEYNLNPTKDGVIISHSEGCKRGVASNHGDVEHIWSKYGLTMDGFRKAVKKEYDALIGVSNAPTTNTFKSYKVKITTPLNVRKGAGVEYPIVQTTVNNKKKDLVLAKGDVYTIVEEKKASNGKMWGKLKSGAGYINLAYTSKC